MNEETNHVTRDARPTQPPAATNKTREPKTKNHELGASNMSRTGRIARLPDQVREQLYERLADGQASTSILAWLNDTPQARSFPTEHLGVQPIDANDLNDWCQTAHQDWLQRRAHQHQRPQTIKLIEREANFL